MKNIGASLTSSKALSLYSITGTILGSIFAVIATKKAMDICNDENFPEEEIRKKLLLLYLPAVLCCGVSIGSTIVLNNKNAELMKLNCADFAVGATSAAILTKKSEKVQEEEVDEEGDPYVWFYISGFDDKSDRFFKSTKPKVQAAETAVMMKFLVEGCATLNDLYSALDQDLIPEGDWCGWSYDVADEYGYKSIQFRNEKIETSNDSYYYEIKFSFEPVFEIGYEMLKQNLFD